MIIAPSILNLKKEDRINMYDRFVKSNITMIHIDVMDNVFVPNITDGLEMINSLKDYDFVIDTHLMVKEPLTIAKQYYNNSDFITIHYEACSDVLATIKEIKKHTKVGLSIKPSTSVYDIVNYLPFVDEVLIMSVEPGFGGQSFMESAYEKVSILNKLRSDNDNFDYIIEVDGGINTMIAKKLATCGCNVVVMGTYILKCEDILKEVTTLEQY